MDSTPKIAGDFFPYFALLKVAGKDATSFLNNILTINTNDLTPPLFTGRKALILNPRGEILFVLWVFKTKNYNDDYTYLILTPQTVLSALTNFLNQRIFLEAVTITHQLGNWFYHKKPFECSLVEYKNLAISPPNTPYNLQHLYVTPLPPKEGLLSYGWVFKLKLSGKDDYIEYHPNPDTPQPKIEKNNLPDELTGLMLQGGNGLALFHNPVLSNQEQSINPIISALALPNLAEYVDFNKGCYPGQEIITRSHTRGQSGVFWLVGLMANDQHSSALLNELVKSHNSDSVMPNQAADFEFPKLDKLGYGIKLFSERGEIGKLWLVTDSPDISTIALALIHRDHARNEEITLLNPQKKDTQGSFRVVHGSFIKPNDTLKSDDAVDDFDTAMTLGLESYHQNGGQNYSVAEAYFRQALALNPSHPDPWEAIAVIKEKQGFLEEAIRLNEQFAELSKDSPLPHTNLSRLYMHKGWIECAEAEKQKATVLMFRQTAKENRKKAEKKSAGGVSTLHPTSVSDLAQQNNQDQLNILNQVREERNRKKKMFQEVLKLDPEDEIANFGLGKILFEEQDYRAAIPHLETTIKTNPRFSLAYSFLGKSLFKTEQVDAASDVLIRGITCAKTKGEMLPLKAMEETLKTIKAR